MELLDYRRTPYQMVPRIEWYFSHFFLPKRSLCHILERNVLWVMVIIINNIYVLIAGGSRK